MTKILVLGNSHVGALRAGFQEIKKNKHTNSAVFPEFYFAGFRGRLLDNFYLNSDLDLLPDDPVWFEAVVHDLDLSLNAECIPLSQFDNIAIVQGPSLFYPYLYYADEGPFPISSALIDELCASFWFSSACSQVSGMWKEFDRFTYISPCIRDLLQRSELQAIYIGTPIPSLRCLGELSRKVLPVDVFSMQQVEALHGKILSSCARIDSAVAGSCPRIFCPPEKLFDNHKYYSNDQFFGNGLRVDGKTLNPDLWHANSEYGKVLISSLLDVLG